MSTYSERFFGESRATEGLGKESLRSGSLSIAGKAINSTVQIGSIIVLGRLLVPGDFGLVAMVGAITGFATILADLGTRDAAVQKSSITPNEVSALFWLSVGIGSAATLLVVLCSPLIAKFYREPRLVNIAIVSSLAFILSSLSCQHHALLRRAMMFKRITVLEVLANLLGAGTAVTIAILGGGYWALVLRPVVTASSLVVGVWWSCRWCPVRPRMTPGVWEMIKFGLHILGFTMTDYVCRSADRVALGRSVGARPLGYYQQSLNVYDNLLGMPTIPLHSVAVASLSKLRDDLDRLRSSWAKALSSLAFFAMPAFGLLAITAQDVLVVLLGEKWSQAGFLLVFMAIRGIPHVVERSLGWLHVAAGRADRWMRWGIFAALLQMVALACGLSFGTLGVVIAYAANMYILFVPAIVYAGRPLGIGASMVLRVVGAPLSCALIGLGIGFAVRFALPPDLHRLLRIALLTIVYVLVYGVLVIWVFRVREPLRIAARAVAAFLPEGLRRWFDREEPK